MANFKFNDLNTTLGTAVKVYVNGTTSLTDIDENILNGSDLTISYEFRKIGYAYQGEIDIQLSDNTGDIETNYAALRDGTWLVYVDSTEYFRGTPDKSSFVFNRATKTVSLTLLTGKINDQSLTYTITKTFPEASINELIEEIFDQLFSVSTINYDVDFAYSVDSKNAYMIEADAGAQDVILLVEDGYTNRTVDHFKQILSLFACNYCIWKGEAHIWYKNNYFSHTVTITPTAVTTLQAERSLDYKQDEYYKQIVMNIHRFDTAFSFKKDKRYLRSADSEVIDYESDNFIPWWKNHSSSWDALQDWGAETINVSGDDEYWWGLVLRNNYAGRETYQTDVTPSTALNIGDTIRVKFQYMNFTNAKRFWFRVGTGIWKSIPIDKNEATSTDDTTDRGQEVEFEYTVDTAGDIAIRMDAIDIWDGAESAFKIIRSQWDAGAAGHLVYVQGGHDADLTDGIEDFYIRGTEEQDGNYQTNAISGAVSSDYLEGSATSGDKPTGAQGILVIENTGRITNDVTFSEVATDKMNIAFDSARLHRLAIGDRLEVTGTTNFDGFYTVSALINAYTVQVDRTQNGDANETGECFKLSLDKSFYFKEFQCYVKQPEPIVEITDYEEDFGFENNLQIVPYKKGTGAGFLIHPFIDESMNSIAKKSLEIYNDRNGTEYVKRLVLSLHLNTINPWTRIQYDSVYYFIKLFKFNLVTGITDLECLEA